MIDRTTIYSDFTMAAIVTLDINGQQARSAPSPTELGFTRVRDLKRPKSDKSDFGWEREHTEIVALSSTLIVKLLYWSNERAEKPTLPCAIGEFRDPMVMRA